MFWTAVIYLRRLRVLQAVRELQDREPVGTVH